MDHSASHPETNAAKNNPTPAYLRKHVFNCIFTGNGLKRHNNVCCTYCSQLESTLHNLQKKQAVKKHLGWDETSPSCSQSHCCCAHRLERFITREEEQLPPPDGRWSRGSHRGLQQSGFQWSGLGTWRCLRARCAFGGAVNSAGATDLSGDGESDFCV